MQKFGTCYAPNSRKLNAFPRSRVRMKVDRKAVALDATELDEKKEKEIDDNKVLKISTFRGVSSDSSSTDNEGKKKSDINSNTDNEVVQVVWTRDDEKKKSEMIQKSDTSDKSSTKISTDKEKSIQNQEESHSPSHTDVKFDIVKSTGNSTTTSTTSGRKKSDTENYKNASSFGSSKIVQTRSHLEPQRSLQSSISSSSSMPCIQMKVCEEMPKNSVNSVSASGQCSSSIATGTPSSVSVSSTESNTSLLVPNSSSEASADNVIASLQGISEQTPSILSISQKKK